MTDPDAPPGPPVRPVPLQKVREARGQSKIPVPRSKVASTRAFRRVRADRVFGLAGVLLVVAATVLVFTWPEPPVKEPPSFALSWPETTYVLHDDDVDLVRGDDPLVMALTIPHRNVTRVLLAVNWSDDVGDEGIEYDTVAVNLTGPPSSNATLHAQGTAATLGFLNVTRTQALAKLPDLREVPAGTEDEARRIIGDLGNDNGTGEWTLEATLAYVGDDFKTNATRAVGECPEASPPQVCIRDPGQRIHVYIEYRAYHLELTPG